MRERKRNRMAKFDYSSDNLYFVTSCVEDRLCCFGNVANQKMHLNEYGQIAHQQFEWLETQYEYVVLHEFVVMPNHVHAVIEINRDLVGTGRDSLVGADRNASVGTGRDLSLPTYHVQQPRSPKIKSLSELMGAYKTTSSKQIHLAGLTEFKWQRSFHDRIIRNDGSYGFIVNYILRNPEKWTADDIFPNE